MNADAVMGLAMAGAGLLALLVWVVIGPAVLVAGVSRWRRGCPGGGVAAAAGTLAGLSLAVGGVLAWRVYRGWNEPEAPPGFFLLIPAIALLVAASQALLVLAVARVWRAVRAQNPQAPAGGGRP